MGAGKRKGSPAPDVVKVGIIIFPEDGEIGGREAEIMLSSLWAGVGRLEFHLHRGRVTPSSLEKALKSWSGRKKMEIVCTVGGCGHLPGDFVPDVTRPLLHRRLPGVEERMYLSKPGIPEDMLFRGAAGIRGGPIILNLPRRQARVKQILRFLAPVLRHALEKIAGDESECATPPVK
jgi:molybdopterin adenylyltransferase